MTVESALAIVLDKDAADRRAAIRVLVESTEEGLEDRLLALVEEDPPGAVAWDLLRVLAERRPDRDPAYLLDRYHLTKSGRRSLLSRLWPRYLYRSPVGMLTGVTRLRLAAPVEHYARDAVSRRAQRRLFAVWYLGDTADPAAVPHVVRATRDRRWGVRYQAADALRRLARHGAIDREAAGGVVAALVPLLADRHPEVGPRAAAALAEPVLRDRLAPEDAARVDAALADGVPPLPPTWDGEDL